MKQWILTWVLMAGAALPANAGGLDALESFIRSVKTARAEFSQVHTSLARQGEVPKARTSSGTFEFSRPSRFRFVYRKPFEQVIVADGQTLWLYDPDLNQVTARKQAEVLGATPAALIASALSLKALESDFELAEAPPSEGMDWVLATPKSHDSSLKSVRVGLRGTDLARLEILDSFGQKSVLTFTGFAANVAFDPAAFQFKVPKGADLVRQ